MRRVLEETEEELDAAPRCCPMAIGKQNLNDDHGQLEVDSRRTPPSCLLPPWTGTATWVGCRRRGWCWTRRGFQKPSLIE